MASNRSVGCLLGLVLLLLLPVPAAAADAEIRQAMLRLADKDREVRRAAIDALVETKDQRLVEFLESYKRRALYRWEGRLVLCEQKQMTTDEDYNKHAPLSDPLTRRPLLKNGKQIVVPSRVLQKIRATRLDRRIATEAIRALELNSADPKRRRSAARKLGDQRNIDYLDRLAEMRDNDSDDDVRFAARESILLIRLDAPAGDATAEARLAAGRELGEMHSGRALSTLQRLVKQLEQNPSSADAGWDAAQAGEVLREAIDRIESYQRRIGTMRYLFQGLSRGSVLILMALGLSITFGVMGVINMAHGELMMIGAVATYAVQRFFVLHFSPEAFNWYYVAALPVAIVATAVVGFLIEFLVVRHLYGRPLETLLATWGIGLLLIVSVRLLYGYNIGVNAPTWARGGVEVVRDLIIPYSRLFIILLAVVCVLLVYWLLNFTKIGLLIRATMQNREMAASLGVNTRRIDAYTFALGAALAGIAGWGVTLIAGVSPNMGSTYIVDSFLVVVTGGVGKIAGTVWAGLGLGVIDKFLEPLLGAIWGKVMILIAIVMFIQWRPQGLFPPKGRIADGS